MSEIESKDFFRERLAVHRALAAQSPQGERSVHVGVGRPRLATAVLDVARPR
ncbi:MAG TPA: hypothetical protein VER34_22100 [Mycobacterium sp.]|jgi:hypothetical protein|nr:hypothetical protein [Mycobacterium sp.]